MIRRSVYCKWIQHENVIEPYIINLIHAKKYVGKSSITDFTGCKSCIFRAVNVSMLDIEFTYPVLDQTLYYLSPELSPSLTLSLFLAELVLRHALPPRHLFKLLLGLHHKDVHHTQRKALSAFFLIH